MKTRYAAAVLALLAGYVAYATSPPVLPDPLAAGWDGKKVREVTIKEGDYFPNDGVPWHEVLNIGDTTTVYLLIEPK